MPVSAPDKVVVAVAVVAAVAAVVPVATVAAVAAVVVEIAHHKSFSQYAAPSRRDLSLAARLFCSPLQAQPWRRRASLHTTLR